ncbi:stAR-related lipid transfer protein 6-like [Saccoglossus kowalevskii]|uniref:Steroidogenic acute regulatory protein, mitochondrial-like n=1 Tax=Saccoglossus kowalevskii TaxID=10224 RepID=A0ABM0GZB3_SACKO|nr:PREDICTED: steroidogenic acute regulatory protein, mitochondrial-like [Saccoglossus kowalevskii]
MSDETQTAVVTEPKPEENTEAPPKEDKPADEAKVSDATKKDAVAAAPVLVAPTESPFGEDDFEHILQIEASEGAENGWESAKKSDAVKIFRKKDKNSEINLIKSYLTLPGIPADKAMELLTNYEERKKWDKGHKIDVLDEKSDFCILYSVFKMPAACTGRDFVIASTKRSDEDNKRHIILYKDCVHPDKPPNNSLIRGETIVNGFIVRQDENDEKSSRLTVLQQLEMKGWIPKFLLNRLTLARPIGIRDDLNAYWKEINKPKENGPTDKKEEKKEEGEAEKTEDKEEEPKEENTEEKKE